MAPRKCNTLTLAMKVKVIEAYTKDKLSVKQCVEKFKCGKTQIYEAIKNKEKIMEEWLAGNGEVKRKAKATGNEDLNKLLWEWFVAARSKNVPISGLILQTQALALAKELGKTDFKASNGWLESFKRRHCIVWNEICGEAKDVDQETVSQWEEKLKMLKEPYATKDIYNGDETGLFFRLLPSKTLAVKREKCTGGKLSKERLTVFLCGNMDGRLEKPLVIGKAAKPRCFKNIDTTQLPVIWRANKKAWMTAELMSEWLKIFDRKMKREGHKVILFLDNATCHPHLKLSNVKLAWFPANTTSVTQPMDQGVIYTMKTHYRKLLLQSLVANISTTQNVHQLVKSITVLDAVNWISMAWKSISADTICKCFVKAGFSNSNRNDNEELPEIIQVTVEENNDIRSLFQQGGLVDSEIDRYIDIDKELATESTFTNAVELIDQQQDSDENMDDDQSAETTEIPSEPAIKSYQDALEIVHQLQEFALFNNCPELLEPITSTRHLIEKRITNAPRKQATLLALWGQENQ
ncbi:tigger transposable element-derived protein 4-like [Bombina bombina]|uniref:tigger transposable element-derived protein 4-like n=1 Tax=Bombina bombina TaxID=8345 RepID=UPI00235AEFBA|nr:tigger transposable element-derived protein 4-like [Bombina bombina]